MGSPFRLGSNITAQHCARINAHLFLGDANGSSYMGKHLRNATSIVFMLALITTRREPHSTPILTLSLLKTSREDQLKLYY